MKIGTIIDARPQFIKVATLSRVVSHKDNIIQPRQHYDTNEEKILNKIK